MPTIEENRALWGTYDWPEAGEEWSAAWGDSRNQWRWTVLPRIADFVPSTRILEIGSGYGRWTKYLKDLCNEYIGIDLVAGCVTACRRRFASAPNVSFHATDGRSLPMIADSSIDFIFSFDSLVHAERDTCEAYIAEFARVLTRDGAGFIHHSNLGEYPSHYRWQRRVPYGRRLLARAGLLDNDGARGTTMTAETFASAAASHGLVCRGQEIVNWGSRRLIDCMSSFTRAGSTLARPTVVMRNPSFMREARYVRSMAPVHSAATADA